MFEDNLPNLPILRKISAEYLRREPDRLFTSAEALLTGCVMGVLLDKDASSKTLYGPVNGWEDYPPFGEIERDMDQYQLSVYSCLTKWLSPESTLSQHPQIVLELFKFLTDLNVFNQYKKEYLPKLGLDPKSSEEELAAEIARVFPE